MNPEVIESPFRLALHRWAAYQRSLNRCTDDLDLDALVDDLAPYFPQTPLNQNDQSDYMVMVRKGIIEPFEQGLVTDLGFAVAGPDGRSRSDFVTATPYLNPLHGAIGQLWWTMGAMRHAQLMEKVAQHERRGR